MIKPFFSIVCTCYNSSAFIKRAVDSIKSQNFSSWELIIVDDCSTDDTFSKCVKYSKIDSRIKVFRMEKNSGPYLARRFGIKQIKGEYLLFLDSDDEYANGSLLSIYKIVKKNSLDCLFYNVFSVSKNKLNLLDCYDESDVLTDSNIIFTNLFSGFLLKQGLYRKCFNIKTINTFNNLSTTNSEYKMFEDGLETVNLISKCRRVKYVNSAFYIYHTDSSNSLTKNKKILFKNISALDEIISIVLNTKGLNTATMNFCLNNLISCICTLVRNNYLSNNSFQERKINNNAIRNISNFNAIAKVPLDKKVLKTDLYLFYFFKKKNFLFVNIYILLIKFKERKK